MFRDGQTVLFNNEHDRDVPKGTKGEVVGQPDSEGYYVVKWETLFASWCHEQFLDPADD